MLAPADDTVYVARVLALTPSEANEAFSRLRDDLAVRSADPDHWALPLGRWRLELRGGGMVEPPPGAHWWPMRHVRGVLRRGVRHTPVELELLPWSDTQSEVSLRPTWRRCPSGRRRKVYLQNATLAIETIAHEIETWAEARREAARRGAAA